jgi:urea transport system permease protein
MAGAATLYGAVLGAIGSTMPRPGSPARFRRLWLFALGGLFVLVTLFLPRGHVGPGDRCGRRRARKRG